MPPRLRGEVRAVHGATETLVGPGVEIDAELLVTLARACRDAVRVRFGYAGRDGGERERTVEPVRMVATNRRWYLMAWDVDRDGWRTFRLDRMHEVTATTWRFRPREHPDPVAYVQRSVTAAPYRHVARVWLDAPADRVRSWCRPRWGGSRTRAAGGACSSPAATTWTGSPCTWSGWASTRRCWSPRSCGRPPPGSPAASRRWPPATADGPVERVRRDRGPSTYTCGIC